jgi:hypothetical protein
LIAAFDQQNKGKPNEHCRNLNDERKKTQGTCRLSKHTNPLKKERKKEGRKERKKGRKERKKW